MPASPLSKGIEAGWVAGEGGWGDIMNANLARINAMLRDSWAQDMDTTTGLTFGYRGGLIVNSAGSVDLVGAGTVALTASATNYVSRTAAGVVSAAAAWPANNIPMAIVTTGPSTITTVIDARVPVEFSIGGHLTVPGRLKLTSSLELLGAAALAIMAGTFTIRNAGDTLDLLKLTQAGKLTIAENLEAAGIVKGTSLDVTGSVNAPGGLNASQLLSGTVPSARVTGGYSGINALGTLLGLAVAGRAYTARSSQGNLGAAKQFDWTISNVIAGTLNAASCTITYANAVAGQSIVLELKQDASGNRTVVWPAGTLWEGGFNPGLSTAANKTDLVMVYYNGTNYFNQLIGQGF